MLIEQITRCLQGRLTEEEQTELWVHLIQNPDDLALMKTYKMYRELFKAKAVKEEQEHEDQAKNGCKTTGQIHTNGKLPD